MNVNSLAQLSYQNQLPSNSVQSQSSTSSFSPETSTSSSTLFNTNSSHVDKAVFSNAAQQLANRAVDGDGDNDGGRESSENVASKGLEQALKQPQQQRQSQVANTQNFQSILMKNILSAYGISNTATNPMSLQA